jgi:short-subunit dehydrogenase
MKQKPFFDNSVIITGASLGIGRELALQLAEQGAWLTLAARNASELDHVADLCRQKGARAIAVPTDISDEGQCRRLIDHAIGEYGRIDTLINNAGIGHASRFEQMQDLSSAEKVMSVNFWGSVYCTHHALQYLKQTKGRIVVVNSGAGKACSPNCSFYAASKYALDGFFGSLRLEIEASGVTITSVYPPWVATGISSRAIGLDGRPVGGVNPVETGARSVSWCAKVILGAAQKRKRDELMTPLHKIGYIIKPIFPSLIDQAAKKAYHA